MMIFPLPPLSSHTYFFLSIITTALIITAAIIIIITITPPYTHLSSAKSPEDIHKAVKAAEKEFEALLSSTDFTTTIGLLRSMAYTLRRQHWIDPNVPTLICVGAPNVGKSSIVRCVSSSKTKVQMYRFTTRKLTMGHAEVDGFMCQVTDSPGMLYCYVIILLYCYVIMLLYSYTVL